MPRSRRRHDWRILIHQLGLARAGDRNWQKQGRRYKGDDNKRIEINDKNIQQGQQGSFVTLPKFRKEID